MARRSVQCLGGRRRVRGNRTIKRLHSINTLSKLSKLLMQLEAHATGAIVCDELKVLEEDLIKLFKTLQQLTKDCRYLESFVWLWALDALDDCDDVIECLHRLVSIWLLGEQRKKQRTK